MDDEELFLTGLASGLDLPTAAAMSADDDDGGGDDSGGDDDNKQTGCGCLSVRKRQRIASAFRSPKSAAGPRCKLR